MDTTLTNSTEWDILPILKISIHVVNFFLGLPLNIYIIALLFPSRGVMDASDVFSLNQAIPEMFFVLLGPFQGLCSVYLKLCFFTVLGFFLGTSLSSCCLFQCCVCLERYLAVVHPVTFLRYKPLRYRVACSIVTWVCSLAVGVACSCTYPKVPYTVFSFIYLLVLTVDSFCCVSILRKLRHPGPRDKKSNVGEMNAAKRKAFQVVFVNLLAFLVQNIPISVAFGIQNTVSEYVFSVAVTISVAVNTVTGFLRPFYVLHRAGKLPLIQCKPCSSCCSSAGPTKSDRPTVAL